MGKDLIPIGGRPFTENASPSFDDYLQDLLAIPYEKDGEYYDRNLDEEYLAYLRLFRKMNEEGLISPEIFLNDQNEINENIEDGRYFCMIYPRTDLVDQELTRYNNDPDSIYIAIDGPKNSRGDDYVLPTNGMAGWTVTMISKKCKNPEAAIKLIDFLLSEDGQKLTYLGVEGVTYDIVNGKPVLKQSIKNYMKNDRQTYNEKYCADYNLWMLMDLAKQLDFKQELEEPLAQMEEWTYPYASYTGYYDIYLPENSRLGSEYLQLKKLWGRTLKKLMICGSDEEFESILASYKKERYNYGYEDVHAEETRQMEENKKK
ncbi:MAG: extracellular solute-binding protein [Catonella sp.]|nr:extracellular solute-binding protein [Catonella sp.]MDY6356416.1 extracellular solute-binding protein [Catonella sp.]